MSAASKNEINFEVIKKRYIDCLKKYVVIDGRARRQEFWIFFFCNLVLGMIPVVGQIVALVTFIPNITVAVRRLHDTNRSGKWLLILFVPFVVGIIIASVAFLTGFSTLMSGGIMGFGIIGVIAVLFLLVSFGMIVLFIVWAAQEGTRGKNKYGPDPKTTHSRTTTAAKKRRR